MKQYAFLLQNTWHRLTIRNEHIVHCYFIGKQSTVYSLTRKQCAHLMRMLRLCGAEQRMPEDFDIVFKLKA